MLVPIAGDYVLLYTPKTGLAVQMLTKVTPKRAHWFIRGEYQRSAPRDAIVGVFQRRQDAEQAMQSAGRILAGFRDREHRNDVEFAQAVARFKAEAERIENVKLAELKRHAPKWVLR